MSRHQFPCPVSGCPRLRDAGAYFCPVHWSQVKPKDKLYLAHFANHGETLTVRRMVAAQVEIFEAPA